MHRPRHAFSLFQLLVVLALLVVLLGVAFPAILKARVAAKRAERVNNLKQLGLACHNYHDSVGRFPSGVDANNFSAAAHLLPYVEQDNLFKPIDLTKPCTDKANENARKTLVKNFVSPNDPQKTVTEDGPTNYLFSAGSKPQLVDNDGVFYQGSKVRITDITDGTSNTFMIGETLKGDGGTKAVDVKRQHVQLDVKAAEKGVTDDTGAQDWKEGKHIAGDRCARWIDGRFLQGTFTGTLLPNDARPDVDFGGAGGLSALRTLDDIVNITFCDGSVRSIPVGKVKLDMWKAFCTRSGGEVINFDF